MSRFHDLTLKVKINAETYVKFDGTDFLMLKNMNSSEGLSLKYDIMLILYELVEWKTVGELIGPWPPEDQEKIIKYLSTLEDQHIIVASDTVDNPKSESGLSEHLGKNIHINVENHHYMLRDYVRVAAYRRAIERAIQPGMIALDLGCGSGVLSFFAAKAGADKVFAIERRPDILLLASELAKANGLKDKIEFVEGASSHIEEERISPKADVLVSEILGNGILEENVVEFTLDARRRFLKPGGRLIPYGLDIHFFAFDSGVNQSRMSEVKEFTDLYGIDFTLLGMVMCKKATTRLERYNPMLQKPMSEPIMVKSLDFRTLEEAFFTERFEIVAKCDGRIDSFCGYFKAHLDEDTQLTNSPWAPSTHWTHLIYTLSDAIPVKAGDVIAMEVVYDGALRVRVAED
jgi:protein arginine N-methyltransferase 1